jgi:2-methylcitrate dehydratase PrpD
MGATREIGAWVAGASLEAMPDQVLERARAGIIDTIGVILAGTGEPVTRIAAGLVAEDGAAPVASQLGTTLRTTPESAALLNGISGHALDYDDVSASLTGHPSVVVVPAALAVAELAGASGAAFLCAYVAGVEVMAKLGLAIGPAHYRAGWHATSTLGTLGAAMAAGKVFRLDPGRLVHALAIAVSTASGSRQNFGTMTKPFHPGHAARCGLLAALLARNGMTGDEAILEAPLGFFALFSFDEARIDGLPAALGRPFDLTSPGVNVKLYPCCYAIHRAADAVLGAVRERGISDTDVRSVEVIVPAGGLAPLIHDRPTTGLESKFSMQYALAAAILDGRLSLETFSDEMVQRPRARALLSAIHLKEDSAIPVAFNPLEEGHVVVRIHLRSGDTVDRRVDHARGSADNPLDREELRQKFRDCARRALPPEQAEQALTMLERLDDVPRIDDLVHALVPAGMRDVAAGADR